MGWVLCDYYSKFPIIKKIPCGQSTGNAVVYLTKCVFSEEGVPEIIISDNGPHYDCKSYREFSKEWDFQHIMSSPRYPQSNGFIKRQVQTVKHTYTKAKKSGQDPHMSLLCLRSIPVDSQLLSPAELLYQCKLQSNLPIRVGNQIPDKDKINQQLTDRQQRMKCYHDRSATDLGPLTAGQPVRAYTGPSNKEVAPRYYKLQETRTPFI